MFGFRQRERRAADPARALGRELSGMYPALNGEFIVVENGDVFAPRIHFEAHPLEFDGLVRQVGWKLGQAQMQKLTAEEFSSMRSQIEDEPVYAPTTAERSPLDSGAMLDVEFNPDARSVLDEGIHRDASDIYLKIRKDHTLVAYRTHGITDIQRGRLTRPQGLEVVRSIWTRGAGSFEETSPCDVQFEYDGWAFRGASLATIRNGVDVVIRIRDPTFHLPLDQTGYSNRQIGAITACAEAPGGLLLFTGETNSGKSSSLATLMARLPMTYQLIEISDPVEVVFEHMSQVQINRYAADAEEVFKRNRSQLVRSNPDALVLGEVRDEFTADAAREMSVQGKRVLSTLHTQSCRLSFQRMINLGIPEEFMYEVGAIAGIINQNLVPVLCPECKRERPTDDAAHDVPRLTARHEEIFKGKQRYKSGIDCGAAKCRGGIIGQTLVAEVYPMAPDRSGTLLNMIREQDNPLNLERYVAETYGLETKHQHAYAKVASGQVDAERVDATIGRLAKMDETYPKDLGAF